MAKVKAEFVAAGATEDGRERVGLPGVRRKEPSRRADYLYTETFPWDLGRDVCFASSLNKGKESVTLAISAVRLACLCPAASKSS